MIKIILESKICAPVLLNLLKLVAKKEIKCSASLTFYLFSPTCLINSIKHEHSCKILYLYPPQTLFVGGILFSRCPSVRPSIRPSVHPSVRPSVTLCFLNILKSHCWIFIKPCKHVHICKTNFLDKKVRARGQFYQSYFPL